MELKWINLPEELQAGAAEVADLLGYTIGSGYNVHVRPIEKGLHLKREGNDIEIGYHKKCEFFRAMSLLGRMETETEITEVPKMELLCLMADQSRNGVFTVDGAKRMMRYIAAMGYDSMMLYTEDTYEIPEYPYFGHLRGRFSHAELKELDAYALSLGIELIPCIQTLAHLNALRTWRAFSDYFDIDDILLAEDEKVYELIEAMFRTVSECFTSRRINIGMDEADNLGRGVYLDRNGYSPKSDIMLRHLAKVVEICNKYGFKPMMWSDMFFRMAFNGEYYVKEGRVPPEVVAKVPPEVELVYWDYYTCEKLEDMFAHMVSCHKEFKNNKIMFAGGAWNWSGVVPKNTFSMSINPMQIRHCLEAGINEIIVTTWGDDGAECSLFGVLPTMLQYAELCYSDASHENLDRRSKECFGISIDDFLLLDLATGHPDTVGNHKINGPTAIEKNIMYSDAFNGVFDRHIDPVGHPKYYAESAKKQEKMLDHPVFGYLFRTQYTFLRMLELKAGLSRRITAAYKAGDRATLKSIADKDFPETIRRLEAYIIAFREQWYAERKTFGFEVQESRLGGLKERLIGCRMRLESYLAGEIDRIEELEQPSLTYDGKEYEGVEIISSNTWNKSHSAGIVRW